MKIDKDKFLKDLYNKLPAVYRQEDSDGGLPFYRYLQALVDGGFVNIIDGSNNLLDLLDPERCPEEVLPLFYKSVGLTYFKDIGVEYHRRFLSNFGALMKRRGTYRSIKYLVATLTGLDVDLTYERRYNNSDKHGTVSRDLTVKLIANTVEQVNKLPISMRVVERFISTQLPFYITVAVTADVEAEILEGTRYTGGVISYSCSYRTLHTH